MNGKPLPTIAGPTLCDEGYCRVVTIEANTEFEANLILGQWMKEHERILIGGSVFAVTNWPGGGTYQRVEVRNGAHA